MLFTRLNWREMEQLGCLQGGLHQTKSSKLVIGDWSGWPWAWRCWATLQSLVWALHGSRTQRPRKPTRPYLSPENYSGLASTSFEKETGGHQPPASRAEKPALPDSAEQLHLEACVDSLAAAQKAFNKILQGATNWSFTTRGSGPE